MPQCPVCETEGANGHYNFRDGYDVTCPRCGEYTITRSAVATIEATPLTPAQAANAAGWLRENPDSSISSVAIDWLRNLPTPSVAERADKLLLEIARRLNHIGENLTLQVKQGAHSASWLGVTWSQHPSEVMYLLSAYLRDRLSAIDGSSFGGADADWGMTGVSITPKGHERIDSLRRGEGVSHIGFCAMWFHESMNPVWADALAPAIGDAGYKPLRIDKHEHTNKIDDEIIAMIRRSRFVVADFTGHRGGAYFEAGFALGLGLRVFWTCRKDELEMAHFDTRQYNTIDWDAADLPKLRKRLATRIEAVMGRGPVVQTA